MSPIPTDGLFADVTNIMNATGDTPQCPPLMWSWIVMAIGLPDYILSLPTTLWALWTLIRNSALETDLLVFNILCIDIMGTILSHFFFLMIFVSSYMSTFINGVFFLYHVYLNGYPLFQCCMCFERYVAVVHPVFYLKYKMMRYKFMCLLLMWMATLLISVINFTFSDSRLLLVILILIVGIQTFFSLSILKVLKRSGPGDGKRQQENEAKRRAFVIVVLVQLKLLFNYMPYIVLSMLQKVFSDYFYYCYIYFITINVCTFGHFFQALLYLRRVGKFSLPRSFRRSGSSVDE